MILLEDILISDDILHEKFVCKVDACKGACCWEGDWGAPLEKGEMKLLLRECESIIPHLSEISQRKLRETRPYTYYAEPKKYGTPLHDDGTCVYLTYDTQGVGKCGIEMAHEAGDSKLPKPISCQLYPIRYEEEAQTGFKALNYDRWEICRSACSHGEKLGMRLYQFVKRGLIRKFGQTFYDKLHQIAMDLYSDT